MPDPVVPKADAPQEVLVAAGRARLLHHALDALRSQLNASQLSRDAPVSRDTAYRVFRDRDHESVTDAIVAAVAQAANDPTGRDTDAVLEHAIEAYTAGINAGHDPAYAWKLSMEALFEAQFTSARQPVGWLLQATALTASSAWRGDGPPTSPHDMELGRAVLAARRSLYETITERWQDVIVLAMSDNGRRPRHGLDPRSMVVLLHSLFDGLTLRRFIEPGSVPPDLAAEAMYLLYLALTEAGPHDDPRKPDDDRNQQTFDRLLEAAARLWQEQGEVTVDAAVAEADVPAEAAYPLFPAMGDLVDSLVRARVVGGGFPDLDTPLDEANARRHLVGMVRQLRRVRDLADELPHAMAASQAHRPTRSPSFADDFVDNARHVIQALAGMPHPDRLARDLLTFASQGSPGWDAVTALLRTIGYDSD